jgi:hypothetical protein
LNAILYNNIINAASTDWFLNLAVELMALKLPI